VCLDRCGEPPRPIAHIGLLFSALVGVRRLSFFWALARFDNSAPEFNRDPVTRRNRQAGQYCIALA
jgi:hypothetical protein